MVIAGRRRELDAVEMLLERAGGGLGGVLVLAGPAGSGRTALAEAAAERARCRGFQVLRVAAAGGGPGGWAWARLLRDAGVPGGLAARMLAGPGPLDLDAAAVALCSGPPRLVLIDDLERGGAEMRELLAVLAGRAAGGRVAVVATALVRLEVGVELWLGALTLDEVGAVTGEDRPDVRHALWVASRGLPGPALSLAAMLAGLPSGADPVVQLALHAESAEGFLAVDAGLVALAEIALQRAAGDGTRARLLARLAYGLLGDASAARRRRALVHDAVVLARRSADPAVLAEVLDARLHSLWDPEGAEDRLATAADIVTLARASADLGRVGTIRGAIAGIRGDSAISAAGVQELRQASRQVPGHLHEATTARVLLAAGDAVQAGLELDRALPLVLAGSGPRWLAAATDLAAVAAATGNTPATAALHEALARYRGRLVVWAGANTVTGSVAYYLGILAAQLGRLDDAADLLAEAAGLEEEIGALPWLALTLAALAEVLSRRDQHGDAGRSSEFRRRARAIAERLGMPGLLRSLSPPADEWTLRRDGADWLLTAGAEQARLRDIRGLHYLRALLAAPSREITALDLVAGGAGLRGSLAEPVLDSAALDAYRRRLAVLGTELDAADQAGDSARAERAETERQAVLDELGRASGLGGRPRQVSPEDERARVNVTRTLRAALEKISAAAPKVGAHLAASVRTGRACRYEPAPGGPARWHV